MENTLQNSIKPSWLKIKNKKKIKVKLKKKKTKKQKQKQLIIDQKLIFWSL